MSKKQDEIKAQIEENLKIVELKEEELQKEIEKEIANRASKFKPTLVSKSKRLVELNEELKTLKDTAIEDVRLIIKSYLANAERTYIQMMDNLGYIQSHSDCIDMALYSLEEQEKLNFALHGRYQRQEVLSLLALMAEIFRNKGDMDNFAIRELSGISFLLDYNRNDWLR